MTMIQILLIEDNPDHLLFTKRILEEAPDGFCVDAESDSMRGLQKISSRDYDAILCDYYLPGLSAGDLLKELRKKGDEIPFIVTTSSGRAKVAVEMMREGAYDYICKDDAYEGTLSLVVRKAVEAYRMKREQQKAQEALRVSEEKYRMLVETMPAATYIAECDTGRIIYVSPQIEAMLGFSSEEWTTDAGLWNRQIHPLDRESALEKLRGRNSQSESVSAEYRMIALDSREVWIQDTASIVRKISGACMLRHGVIFDITGRMKTQEALRQAYSDLKRTQEQLIQSGKMAAMGQLATGISHELNQPLTGIKGFAQAILLDLDGQSPLRGDIKKIVEQADRMDSIIKNVRFFARKSEFRREELDINCPIHDSLMLLNEQLRVHNIKLHTSYAQGLPKIHGDRNQLQQAFLNFITNARDAIDNLKSPRGGTIYVSSALAPDGTSVVVTFEDTGCGIPQENLKNIFNPFYTTKSPDGGIGLGLAIVYRIIENHEGRIEVESAQGKGTVFRVIIPVRRDEKGAL